MTLQYGAFEIPTQLTVEEEDKENAKGMTYARFVAEPFEKGFGHTLGNSLRRMLLTAIEAPAIMSVTFEGVPHEYMSIEGIVEDVTNIVLNFKGALIRKLQFGGEKTRAQPRLITAHVEVTPEMIKNSGGQVEITLGDLIKDETYEVINPELKLFTVTKPMNKQIDLRIGVGRGYVPSERHVIFDRTSNEILIDSCYSPVRLVNYFVENTRVGQDTDYDRLILEVTTDGRVTPKEALSFAAQIGEKHFNVFQKIKAYSLTFDEGEEEDEAADDGVFEKLALRIDEIELSVRSTNCLSGANIETIAELVSIPDRKMLEFRNFGKKSLTEIKDKLTSMGLHLGMDLTKFGLTPDNVKEKMRVHHEQRRKNEAQESFSAEEN
jgi:DNA-directed RNA polymerase subunit alpha